MNSTTFRTLYAFAWLTACTSVLGAQATMGLGDTLWSIGLGDWFAIAFLSTAFGLLALLQRLKDKAAPKHWARFVSAHMLGSHMAGFSVFMLLEASDRPPDRFFQALAIGLAAFLGATVIDRLAIKVLSPLGVTSSDSLKTTEVEDNK